MHYYPKLFNTCISYYENNLYFLYAIIHSSQTLIFKAFFPRYSKQGWFLFVVYNILSHFTYFGAPGQTLKIKGSQVTYTLYGLSHFLFQFNEQRCNYKII